MKFNRPNEPAFPRALAEGLWVVGNYYFNLYVVAGDQATALVEVGISAVVDDVIRQLDLLKLRPSFLVVTHPHADHLTGLEGLRERYRDALAVAGEGAAEFLNHPKAPDGVAPEDRHMAEFLASQGIAAGRPPVSEPPSLQNCLIGYDGDQMDLGGITLRFMRAAGHAPGKVVVHVPERRALFLSDSLGFRFPGRGVLPLFFTGYADYVATLQRFRDLNAEILGPAHQGPLQGNEAKEAFDESLRAAAELRERIRVSPRDGEDMAAELFKEFYRDELRMYTPENIMTCCRLLVKRARE